MGYKVKNKKEGPFIQDDYAGIVLNIEINKEKQNIDNVIQFDKYIK